MNGLAGRYLTDPRLIQAHTFQALYVGLDPARAPGIYAVIAGMDTIGGVYIPQRGGMHAVPQALAASWSRPGRSCGSASGPGGCWPGSGVTGVRLAAGELVPASSVVVAGDLPAAQRDLLPPGAADWRLLRPHFAPSCLVAHFGLQHQRPGPAASHAAPRPGLGGHVPRADPLRRRPARAGPEPTGHRAEP